jgi:hypothetical protein
MTNIQNNGIAVFENVFNRDYCHSLIKYFEWCKINHKTWNRQDAENSAETSKNDESVAMTFGMDDSGNFLGGFNEIFWGQCYPEYTRFFSTLNDYSRHGILTYKIQKTLPGQGYHIWHCEAMNMESSKRLGTYILYLNDVEEGGETEFLYLNQRIKPAAGTLVIFPTGYVHTHRGNSPLKGEKYILTGWVEFV